jgi:hypothetical protein
MDLIVIFKRLVPPPIRRRITAPYWWWHNRGKHQVAMPFDRRWEASQAKIVAFRNRHAGQRCFIIGNGPSLQHTDLSRLRHETTFGLNRIYLMFPKLGFQTSYFVAVNTLVVEQCANDIQALQMPRFITWRGRRWLKEASNIVYLDTDYTPPESFATDAAGRVFEGSTVTYVALQLAYHMGFDDVILVGVDHNFETQGPANVTVVSQGEDRDHFSPEYFGKGFRWQLPDLEASERAYRLAKRAFEADGRRVRDATVGGKLTIFPKVDYDDLF